MDRYNKIGHEIINFFHNSLLLLPRSTFEGEIWYVDLLFIIFLFLFFSSLLFCFCFCFLSPVLSPNSLFIYFFSPLTYQHLIRFGRDDSPHIAAQYVYYFSQN